MEKVAISETVLPTQEKKDEEKKIEFNVNAKEFVPILSQEVPLEEAEPWNPNQHNNLKPVIKKKIEDNYKPVFMDGMTEKFIEGPYVGNGKDPEIPFVRYYSKGQAIDFFNKKYFSADPSGEILYRPGEGGEVGAEEYLQQKPFLDNVYFQSNIFRPPIIDFLVQDILYRQYLCSARPKAIPGVGRRGGKQQGFASYSRGGARVEMKKDASTEPLPNGSQEVWTDECADKEVPAAISTPVDSPVCGEKDEEKPGELPEPVKSEPTEELVAKDSPKDQRLSKFRGKSFTNSKLSPPDKFKLKNGQKKTDFNINDKNEKAEVEERFANSDEDQLPKKDVIAETEELPVESKAACSNIQEDVNIKSMENLSIEVNITIDAPSKDYPLQEEATTINL